jgi:hypothetical protein
VRTKRTDRRGSRPRLGIDVAGGSRTEAEAAVVEVEAERTERAA